jgi:hypothetical protein
MHAHSYIANPFYETPPPGTFTRPRNPNIITLHPVDPEGHFFGDSEVGLGWGAAGVVGAERW